MTQQDPKQASRLANEPESGQSPSDGESDLVARAETGDLLAWGRLYRDSFELVLRQVLCLTGDPALAEDLVQETFARAFVGIRRFDGRASFATWVRGIAINLVRMHWRKHDRSRRAVRRLSELPVPSASLEESHLQARTSEALFAALHELPPPLREAFALRELEGLSQAEAATLLGISPGNLAVRLNRARKWLREELQRLGWLDSGGR